MNLPSDFISSLRPILGEYIELFLSALNEDSHVSIRVNPFKRHRNPMKFSSTAEPVPWSECGYFLKERPAFTFDPMLHSGYYYVQEASSMFIGHVVKQLYEHPVTCLDLCAAPGGKSLALLSALHKRSLLVSNETVRQRANVLSEILTKFGNPEVVITNNIPKDFTAFSHFFDLILVDAPCSGEGMFRKDEIAIQEWSADNVKTCAARQKNILSDIWPSLKTGGILIYSTCTYNTSENEENALWAANELGAEFIEIEIDPAWGISPSVTQGVIAYRFFPHKTKGEGLFVTILRKTRQEISEAGFITKKNNKKSSVLIKDSSDYSRLIRNPDLFNFIESGEHIVALPKKILE
ncbi:MAG: RsmB/NOP family class I SAM-dependent RNA methyltransferase [Fermentimonas sp.]|nr:RsmB/NOP family class I SAM-dependent RNA methyltransferase [Fermentimonas sp.]